MGLDTSRVVQEFHDAYEQGKADGREEAERAEAVVGIEVARMFADMLGSASVVVRERAPEASEFFTQKREEFEEAVQVWQAPPAPEPEAEAAEPESNGKPKKEG